MKMSKHCLILFMSSTTMIKSYATNQARSYWVATVGRGRRNQTQKVPSGLLRA